MPQKQMVTLDEAAQELGVSRPTIFRLMARGVLRRFKKIGDTKTYIPTDDIEKAKQFEEQQ